MRKYYKLIENFLEYLIFAKTNSTHFIYICRL